MKTSVAAPLVKAIENVWTAIQANNPDVPDVVVTLGTGAGSSSQMKLGHFAANVWTHGEDDIHELFVGAEGLKRGATAVLGTLLHEASHAVAEQRSIKDTSRQGRYHNKNFKTVAEELGITVEHSEKLGWSTTTVPDETASLYSIEVLELDAVITAYRKSSWIFSTGGTATADPDKDPAKPARKSSNNGVVWECQCEEPRKIRMSQKVADLGSITCGECGEEFTEGGYIKLG
jgi:hypothetical protein